MCIQVGEPIALRQGTDDAPAWASELIREIRGCREALIALAIINVKGQSATPIATSHAAVNAAIALQDAMKAVRNLNEQDHAR